jgi:hypothetical protein
MNNLYKIKQKIIVEKGEVKALAKLFNCTVQMVYKSLSFSMNSLLARKIRKSALERGGLDISEMFKKEKK